MMFTNKKEKKLSKSKGDDTQSVFPYQTRARTSEILRNDEVIHSQKECVELAAVLIDGGQVILHQSDFFYVLITDKKVAILKINKIWKSGDNVRFECTMFTPPKTSSSYQYGQDELVEQPQKLLLHQDRFSKMIENYMKLSSEDVSEIWKMDGSPAIKTKHTVLRRSKLGNFMQLKNGNARVKDNISAYLLMEGLKGPNHYISKRFLPISHSLLLGSSLPTLPYVLSYEDYCKHRKLKKALETGVAISVTSAMRYKVVCGDDDNRRIIYFSMTKREKACQESEVEMDKIDDAMYHKYTTSVAQDHSKRVESYVEGESSSSSSSSFNKKRKL